MEFLSKNWWILIFAAGYAFMMFRGGGCCGTPSRGAHGKNNGYAPAEGINHNRKQSNNKIEMVRDPECGMYVSPDSVVQLKIDGVTYYFCSETCKSKFKLKQKGKAS